MFRVQIMGAIQQGSRTANVIIFVEDEVRLSANSNEEKCERQEAQQKSGRYDPISHITIFYLENALHCANGPPFG